MALNKITYTITYAVLYTLSLLPWKIIYLISDMATPIVRKYYRREIVRRQLRESFPEKNDEELETIE